MARGTKSVKIETTVKTKSETQSGSQLTTTTKTLVVEKKEKKVYDLPGQKHDPPEERDGLRVFYESLYNQKPESDMAQIWMMEHGMLDEDVAQRVYDRLKRKGGPKLLMAASPSKSNGAIKKPAIKGRPPAKTPPPKATSAKASEVQSASKTTPKSARKETPKSTKKPQPKRKATATKEDDDDEEDDEEEDGDDDDDDLPLARVKTTAKRANRVGAKAIGVIKPYSKPDEDDEDLEARETKRSNGKLSASKKTKSEDDDDDDDFEEVMPKKKRR